MAFFRYVFLASVFSMLLSRPVCLALGVIAGMWISEMSPGIAPRLTAWAIDYANTAVETIREVDLSKMSNAVEEARKNNKESAKDTKEDQEETE